VAVTTMKTLNYMGTADAEDVLRRISREIAGIEDQHATGEVYASAERLQRHTYLCEVAQACETVIGFLNGEHDEFHGRA
jgi:hypothetical protein